MLNHAVNHDQHGDRFAFGQPLVFVEHQAIVGLE